jgi:hypothetical protein
MTSASAERRRAPRLAVRSRASIKHGDEMIDVALEEMSPVGARLATARPLVAGETLKLYLRNGLVVEARVARRLPRGVALSFSEGAPTSLPAKDVFWKLDSYAFRSGDYAANARRPLGRHLPNEALLESCQITAWTAASARIDTAAQLALGERVCLRGRTMTVAARRGPSYELAAEAAV